MRASSFRIPRDFCPLTAIVTIAFHQFYQFSSYSLNVWWCRSRLKTEKKVQIRQASNANINIFWLFFRTEMSRRDLEKKIFQKTLISAFEVIVQSLVLVSHDIIYFTIFLFLANCVGVSMLSGVIEKGLIWSLIFKKLPSHPITLLGASYIHKYVT